MSTILATSYDGAYPWGPAWKASLDEHCNLPVEIIDMDSVSTQMPNRVIQHGEFLDFLKPGNPDDVIIFSDADCILQRPFSESELEFFDRLTFGEMSADYCHTPLYVLGTETLALGQLKQTPGEEFFRFFSGFENLPCYCTGVVVATRETWQVHRKWFEKRWAYVDSLWFHYAKIQWLMGYVMGRYMEARVLPQLVTKHGFTAKMPEMTFDGDTVLWSGEKVAIRHAINLHPPKAGGPPAETEWKAAPVEGVI